jgi:type II secretory pathway predicted ATPase ExeA
MDIKYQEAGTRAFGDRSHTLVTVKYEAQQHALDFIWSVMGDGNSIAMICGRDGAGKSTVVRQFISELPRDTAVGVVDATRIKPRRLLTEVLARFGYKPDLESADELLQMIEVFAAQQTRSYQAPVMIIENVDKMFPSSLQTIGKLAALQEQGRPVLRIVLTSHKRVTALTGADKSKRVTRRPVEEFDLGPMSANEALVYLYARLEAGGIPSPDSMLPGDVCDLLHKQSGGWPRQINESALALIRSAKTFPISASKLRTPKKPEKPKAAKTGKAPRIIVSRNGRKVAEYAFNDRKLLIGRSEFADIVVDDEFSSKFHVLLLLYTDGLVLIDLNSVNGTLVNSVKVKSTLLLDNDIISLGNHRLKVVDVPAARDGVAAHVSMSDTIRMKGLDDLRRKRKARLKLVSGN